MYSNLIEETSSIELTDGIGRAAVAIAATLPGWGIVAYGIASFAGTPVFTTWLIVVLPMTVLLFAGSYLGFALVRLQLDWNARATDANPDDVDWARIVVSGAMWLALYCTVIAGLLIGVLS